MIKKINSNPPLFLGGGYLGVIIVFGFLYSLLPESLFAGNTKVETLCDGLYFSVVTITTLGFGDIYPVSGAGQFLVALEALLGIILIGLFLNAMSYKQVELASNAEKEKIAQEALNNEKKKLKRYYNLLSVTEEKLKLYARRVLTPMEKRGSEEGDFQFAFNDLKDLYSPSLFLMDDYTKPVVYYYYLHLDDYTNVLTKMLLEVDIIRFPEIEKLILQFIKINKELDWRNSILSEITRNKVEKGQSLKDFYKEMIANQEGEPVMLESNAINQFVALYQSLKYNFSFFKKLKTEVGKYSAS